MGISQNRLARAPGVPPRCISEFVHGKHAVTADTAIRLARALGTSEWFWTGLQADCDLDEADQTDRGAFCCGMKYDVSFAKQRAAVSRPGMVR